MHIETAALGSPTQTRKRSTVSFSIDLAEAGMSRVGQVVDQHAAENATVPYLTLDELLRRTRDIRRPLLLKIDVEGHVRA
jgi:FkbM family methyltransferase